MAVWKFEGVVSGQCILAGSAQTSPKDGFTHVQQHIPASLTAPRRRFEAELLYQTHRTDAIFKNPSRSSRHRRNRTLVTAARSARTPRNSSGCNNELRKVLSTFVFDRHINMPGSCIVAVSTHFSMLTKRKYAMWCLAFPANFFFSHRVSQTRLFGDPYTRTAVYAKRYKTNS